MRNSADCVRWLALAGYRSRALSAIIAVDHVAIAGSTIAGIAIFPPVYVGASISTAVFFDLGTAKSTVEAGDLSRRGAGRDGDRYKQCRNSDDDGFLAHFNPPTGGWACFRSAEVAKALRSRRRSMIANHGSDDRIVARPRPMQRRVACHRGVMVVFALAPPIAVTAIDAAAVTTV